MKAPLSLAACIALALTSQLVASAEPAPTRTAPRILEVEKDGTKDPIDRLPPDITI